MYLCINCNAQGVEREGDEFKCPKCGYTWDVAHEQTNAAYLASQGRKPAEPLGEQPDVALTPEGSLLAELGINLNEAPTSEDPAGEPLEDETEGDHFNVRFEGDPDETEVSEDELEIDADEVLIKLEATTVALLRAMAEEHDVDLTGANVKADIIDRLLASGKLTVVYAPDGSLMDVE